jgi:DNA-binding beta-propeller fold protein YncE
MPDKRCLGLSAMLLATVIAGPALAQSYTLQTTLPIPASSANSQGGTFTSFDISFFDPATENYYVADRSNASVDVISGSNLTVVGQATGFTGQQATTSTSGADGVLTVTSAGTSTLFAGDGNSTLKIFNVTNPAAPTLLQSISTGGAFRVDEMAYSPVTHQLLAANNADSPAFATLFNSAANPVTISQTDIIIPGGHAGDGLEQPVWDPNTGSFFISVPAFAGDQGGVAEILTNGTVGRIYKFAVMAGGPASCSPTGLALGKSGNLLVGCGMAHTQAVLLNPDAGSIVKTFPEISGTDEIWYDPPSQNFFVTGADAAGSRVFDVINDASQLLTQSVKLPVLAASNPHSIAVNPFNGDVFVPLAGSTPTVPNLQCPAGCVAVYALPAPKPPMFAGTPGSDNCYGKSISALAKEYGGISNAATDLNYSNVGALKNAIMNFCDG